jgi:hypothetical protein
MKGARPSKQASLTAAEGVVPPSSLRQKLDPQAHITIVDHDWWARHGAPACGCGWAGFALDKTWWVRSLHATAPQLKELMRKGKAGYLFPSLVPRMACAYSMVDTNLHIIGTRLVSTDTLTVGISVRYSNSVLNRCTKILYESTCIH